MRLWIAIKKKSELSEWSPLHLCVFSTHNSGRLSPQIIQTKKNLHQERQKKIRFRVALVSCHSDVKDHCCIHLTQTPYRQSQEIAESHGVEPLLPFNIIHYINHTLRKRRIKKTAPPCFSAFFSSVLLFRCIYSRSYFNGR